MLFVRFDSAVISSNLDRDNWVLASKAWSFSFLLDVNSEVDLIFYLISIFSKFIVWMIKLNIFGVFLRADYKAFKCIQIKKRYSLVVDIKANLYILLKHIICSETQFTYLTYNSLPIDYIVFG